MLFEIIDRTFGPMRLEQMSNGNMSVQGTFITVAPEPQNLNANDITFQVDVTYRNPRWLAFEFSGCKLAAANQAR